MVSLSRAELVLVLLLGAILGIVGSSVWRCLSDVEPPPVVSNTVNCQPQK